MSLTEFPATSYTASWSLSHTLTYMNTPRAPQFRVAASRVGHEVSTTNLWKKTTGVAFCPAGQILVCPPTYYCTVRYGTVLI